jgi:hypothetical protein
MIGDGNACLCVVVWACGGAGDVISAWQSPWLVLASVLLSGPVVLRVTSSVRGREGEYM